MKKSVRRRDQPSAQEFRPETNRPGGGDEGGNGPHGLGLINMNRWPPAEGGNRRRASPKKVDRMVDRILASGRNSCAIWKS